MRLPLLGAAACSGTPGSGPQQEAACTLERQAVLPMELRNGEVIIPARIADRPASLILDTGSEGAMLTEQGAARLNLPADPRGTTTITGTSGTIRANRVLLRGLELGGNEFPPELVPVASLSPQGEDNRPADGLIGAEILSFFDVDLDFPHRRVTLYDVRNCSGNFLPWTTPYTSVTLTRTSRNLLLLPVELDGHPMTALFDTGANRGRVNRSAALQAGVTPVQMNRDTHAMERGVGGNVVPSAVHHFAELEIGGERFHNVELPVAERAVPQADMLLGLPYMVTRHIWLSYATHQMFIERRPDATIAQ
ncbi:MAG TPA: retroviral-like aspartic protease family protein [Acetobacteraceae bacterium]